MTQPAEKNTVEEFTTELSKLYDHKRLVEGIISVARNNCNDKTDEDFISLIDQATRQLVKVDQNIELLETVIKAIDSNNNKPKKDLNPNIVPGKLFDLDGLVEIDGLAFAVHELAYVMDKHSVIDVSINSSLFRNNCKHLHSIISAAIAYKQLLDQR